MSNKRYDIFDLGFDNHMSKPPLFESPTEARNAFTQGVATGLIGSGTISANQTWANGHFQSKNFIAGESGWKLGSDGRIECQELTIGNKTISVSADGDMTIQEAIDDVHAAGGGRVFLQNGTHLLTADITLYDDVLLEGASNLGAIIDFGSAAYQIKIVGSNAYTAGTLAVNDGSTSVTGTDTTWTSAMEGRSIFLGGYWYTIDTVGSTTSITLADAYVGSNLAGETYSIATIKSGIKIKSLTIQNSTTAAIKIQYALDIWLDDLDITNCETAVDVDDMSTILMGVIDIYTCDYGINLNNVWTYTIRTVAVSGMAVGDGLVMTSSGSSSVFDIGISDCAGNGVTATDVTDVSIFAFTFGFNGGHGIEYVSGVTTMQVALGKLEGNTGDGIKLTATSDDNNFSGLVIVDNGSDGIELTATSDRNIFSGLTIKSNSGYGVNIAASSCDNNTISSCTIKTNTSGQIIDAGTGTETRACQGIPDTLNNLPADDHTSTGLQTNLFNAGESITVMDLVYLKSDGEWWKTDADAASTSGGLLGISIQTQTDGNPMRVALPGSFVRDDTWNWSVGSTLYIDTTTAGNIIATQPSGEDDAIRVVGYAVTADVIWFQPSQDFLTYTV